MKTGAKREAENIPQEVWLSFGNKKGFERLCKGFESFDILNLTLLYSTLLNLTKTLPIGNSEQSSTPEEEGFDLKPVAGNPLPPVPVAPSPEREFVEKVKEACKKL